MIKVKYLFYLMVKLQNFQNPIACYHNSGTFFAFRHNPKTKLEHAHTVILRHPGCHILDFNLPETNDTSGSLAISKHRNYNYGPHTKSKISS